MAIYFWKCTIFWLEIAEIFRKWPKILKNYFSRQRGMITRQNPYPTEPINHERIIINYENPKVASSSSAGYSHHHHSYDGHASAMTSRDSDTGSTDSGKPSSLSSNKQPRPTSFRNRYNFILDGWNYDIIEIGNFYLDSLVLNRLKWKWS